MGTTAGSGEQPDRGQQTKRRDYSECNNSDPGRFFQNDASLADFLLSFDYLK
jgi:hypothetical protein